MRGNRGGAAVSARPASTSRAPRLQTVWLSNDFVSFHSFLLTRASITGPGYIFRDRPFSLDEQQPSICFEVMAANFAGSMYMGATDQAVKGIDVESLPRDPMQLEERLDEQGTKTWFPCKFNVRHGVKVRVDWAPGSMRIQIVTESGTGVTHDVSLPIGRAMYPFLVLTADVSCLRILRSNMTPIVDLCPGPSLLPRDRRRNRDSSSTGACGGDSSGSSSSDLLCYLCMDKERRLMCSPCNHVVFCEECAKDYQMMTPRTCPMCRAVVLSIQRIFL